MNRSRRSTLALLQLLVSCLAADAVHAQVVIARQGDVAPGTGGGTFNVFSPQVAIDGLGHVAFKSSIMGGTASEGVFLDRGNGLIAVAVEGDVAPGSGGGTFALVGEPALNALGDLAFTAVVSGGTFGTVLYVYSGGQYTIVATSLDAAPGTNGGSYSAFGPRLSMNAAGEIAFKAVVTGAGNTSSGIFVEGGPSSRPVFLRGEATPAALPGTYFGFGDANINAVGDVVAIAGISPTSGPFRNGVVVETGGVDEIVALVGDPAPGTGAGTYSEISTAATPAIDASRQVFFYAKVTGGTSSSGLFVDDGVTQSAVVLPGQPVPGLAGVNYFAFSLFPISANDAGEIGFTSILTNASSGVFVGPTGAAAQLVAKTGDPVPGTGGGSYFLLVSNPAINSWGRAAFVSQLSGGTTGSVVVAVPEPGAVGSTFAVIGLLAHARRRSKRFPYRNL